MEKTVKRTVKRFVKSVLILLIFCVCVILILSLGVLVGQQENLKSSESEWIIVTAPKEGGADESDNIITVGDEGLRIKEVKPLEPVQN